MFMERSGYRILSVAGIDVSVSFWYVAMMAMITLLGGSILHGALLAAAITVSIVIHEFGHAIPSKLFGLRPSILLHGFGGLCFHEPSDSDWKDILIVLAGPLVQIAAGGLGVLGLFAAAGEVGYTTNLELLLYYFVWVSFVWGAINLVLPLYPLDGGQLTHLILRRFMVEHRAQDLTLKLSIGTAIPVAIFALVYQFFFGLFLVAFLVMDNVNALRSGVQLIDRKAKVRASTFVKDNLAEAENAFAEEDWREAARLCHVIRASSDPVPKKTMDRIWEVLGISATRMGDCDEAIGWLKKAPRTSEVEAAIAECEAKLADGVRP